MFIVTIHLSLQIIMAEKTKKKKHIKFLNHTSTRSSPKQISYWSRDGIDMRCMYTSGINKQGIQVVN